jgi:hypothetical protein
MKFMACGLLMLAPLAYAAGSEPKTPLPLDIDQHALAAPAKEAEKSLDRLAEYLFLPATSEREKARAIYRWMTDRISYDMDALHTGHPGEVRPEAVFQSRKARAAGYAALFENLADRAGLRCVSVRGYVKEMALLEDKKLTNPPRANHVWNAVKVNGCWQLLDATIGAGYVKGQRFHKQFREQFFLMPPSQLIWTHYPSDPVWQLLPRPLSFQQFCELAPVKVGFIRVGLTNEINVPDRGKPRDKPISSTNVIAQIGAVKLLEGPLDGLLSSARDYHFLIEAPHANAMFFQNNHLRIPMRKIGTRFEATIRPEPGELQLIMQPQLRPLQQQNVATYGVK